MKPVCFIVTNTTTVSDEAVVVKPLVADADQTARLVEWRVLPPAIQGSTEFTYTAVIAAYVTAGETRTAAVRVQLGELLAVTSVPNGGIQLAPAGTAHKTIHAAVRNDSALPATLLTVCWTVDDRPVLIQRGLNQGATATLALTNTLLFQARTVPLQPQTSDLLVETDFVAYAIPPNATKVVVTWSRATPAGPDIFKFDPPSG